MTKPNWLVVLVMLVTSASLAQEPGAPAQPATPPAQAPVDQSTPRGALKVLTQAMERSDAEAMRAVLHAQDQPEQRVADAMVEMAQAIGQLRSAAIAHFGQEEAHPLIGDPMDVKAQAYARIDAASETVQEDRAVIQAADDPRPVVLHRVEGQWMVPMAELLRDVSPEEVEQRLEEMAVQTRLMRQMAVEIEGGQFADAESAAQALDVRRTEAVFGPRGPQVQDDPVVPQPAPGPPEQTQDTPEPPPQQDTTDPLQQ